MAELVTLTIDGRTITAPKGVTIWQAAKDAGIFIPIYCYHPKMAPLGACRICLVEVEKMPKPMAGCTTTVTEGMIVRTASQMAESARAGVMEFLLINHPLDCPICDKGGECDLQNYAVEYGQGVGRFREEKRHLDKAVELGPTIALDRERCIMCQRCVRFCSDIVQDEGLIISQRGAAAEIATFPGQPYDSQFSGNTVEICPVGALTSRTYRFKARPWELRHTPSVCTHCAVGCNIEVDARLGTEVVRFMSRTNDAVDDGWLCDRGRYGYGFIQHSERLKSPLLRKNGKLEPVSWPEAFEFITKKLQDIQTKHGGEAIAAIAGTHNTNEELYTFQKFARNTLGTTKVSQRQGSFAPFKLAELPKTLTATIQGMEKAKAILLIGADISDRQPILELRLKKARKLGAKLLFLGGTPGPLARFASAKIEVAPDKLAETVQAITAGVTGETTEAAYEKLVNILKAAGENTAIWFDEAATLFEGSGELLGHLAKLAEATGSMGKAGLGLGALVRANNSTGARDTAGLFESNLDYGTFLKGEAGIKAAYVLGTNPLADIEQFGGKSDSLSTLELLVVHEMFLSDTAKLAHVVLPVSSFAEIEGTYTNTEGRVQKIKSALPPVTGTAPTIAILIELAARLGKPLPKMGVAEIFNDLAANSEAYTGLTYETIGEHGQLRPLAIHRPPPVATLEAAPATGGA